MLHGWTQNHTHIIVSNSTPYIHESHLNPTLREVLINLTIFSFQENSKRNFKVLVPAPHNYPIVKMSLSEFYYTPALLIE